MKLRWTLPAACLLVLAIAMVKFHRNPAPATEPEQELSMRPVSNNQPFFPTAPHGKIKHHNPTASDDTQAPNGRTRSLARHTPAPAIHDVLSQAELENRAQLVEQEADHELARLIPLLDLTADQQDRVFKALAANSPSFVPGMRVDGTLLTPTPAVASNTTGTGTPIGGATSNSQQAVLAQLTDAQVAAYLQDANETTAWWSEYIDHVSSLLKSGTPSVGSGTGTTVATSPTTTDPVTPTTTDPGTPDTKGAHSITGGE